MNSRLRNNSAPHAVKYFCVMALDAPKSLINPHVLRISVWLFLLSFCQATEHRLEYADGLTLVLSKDHTDANEATQNTPHLRFELRYSWGSLRDRVPHERASQAVSPLQLQPQIHHEFEGRHDDYGDFLDALPLWHTNFLWCVRLAVNATAASYSSRQILLSSASSVVREQSERFVSIR